MPLGVTSMLSRGVGISRARDRVEKDNGGREARAPGLRDGDGLRGGAAARRSRDRVRASREAREDSGALASTSGANAIRHRRRTAPKASTSKAPSAVPQVAGVVETNSMPMGCGGRDGARGGGRAALGVRDGDRVAAGSETGDGGSRRAIRPGIGVVAAGASTAARGDGECAIGIAAGGVRCRGNARRQPVGSPIVIETVVAQPPASALRTVKV